MAAQGARMRRWLIIGLGAAVLAAGGLVAAYFIVVGDRPSGKLDTELKGVTVSSNKETPKPKRKKPKTEPVRALDKPCWRNFGGDPQRSLARENINLGRPTRTIWARGLRSFVEYPPSYCNGILYVNGYEGRTFAVNALTGKVIWSRGGQGTKPSTPAIAGSRLIVSSIDGTVTAYNRENGHIIWQLSVDAKVESSPVAIRNLVYFGATDGRLFAVDVRSGRIRWAYDTGGRINSSPSIWGRRICITTYAGSIFCLDRLTGRKMWNRYFKRDFARYDSFYASASTDGKRLFTIARSGKVIAVLARNGKVLWTHHIGSWGYSTPAVAFGRVFIGDLNGSIHAFNAATGREVWSRYVGGDILGGPVVIGKLVFFSTTDTTETYAARVADGRIVWRVHIGKYSPGIATDRHYFFSLNGLLVAYRGRYSPPEQRVRRRVGVAVSRAANAGRRNRQHSKRQVAQSKKAAAASR
jgi:outer membrane protein assembly factor BamB